MKNIKELIYSLVGLIVLVVGFGLILGATLAVMPVAIVTVALFNAVYYGLGRFCRWVSAC